MRTDMAIALGPARAGAGDASTDGPLYDLIELMFFAYRDFVQDADRILVSDGFGRAHHRVLYFVARRPRLTIAELLDILKITKQSLNRVLKDLLDRGYVMNRSGETDRRQRLLEVTSRGEALIQQIAEVQSLRFERAFANLGGNAAATAAAFLEAMVDPQPVDPDNSYSRGTSDGGGHNSPEGRSNRRLISGACSADVKAMCQDA